MLWLLASDEENGEIQGEMADIAFKLRMTTIELNIALMPLIANGMFEDDGNVLARGLQVAIPETETEGETETETKKKATIVATPSGVSDSGWQEFKTLRKAKKATITQRAIDAITSEANKAGWTLEKALEECVVRGWQAFKADWVATKANPADIVRLTVPSKNEPDPALEKIKADAKTTRPPTPEELAIFNSIRRKA
jgi:hypothetical protein